MNTTSYSRDFDYPAIYQSARAERSKAIRAAFQALSKRFFAQSASLKQANSAELPVGAAA